MAIKGYICVTLNEDEIVFIPAQNIEYIGCDRDFNRVVIYLYVGTRCCFSIHESMEEVKALLSEAMKN